MERYKKNLRIEGNKVFSYSTHVATIEGRLLLVHGYWSVTTSKHINYVAACYELTKKEAKKETEPERENNNLGILKAFGALFDLTSETREERIEGKARILFATPGIHKPDEWDALSIDEKENRVNNAFSVLNDN